MGVGELLARLEALKTLLASEGLFDSDRKVSLPLLPKKIGLICGRNTDAEKDVVENAKRRWPSVEFEIREVTVQGAAGRYLKYQKRCANLKLTKMLKSSSLLEAAAPLKIYCPLAMSH